jgi:hypothetical protein
MSKNTSKIFALFAVGAALAGCSALIESKGNGIGAPCEITADGVDPCRTDKGYFCLKAVDGDGFRCALGREPAEDGGTPETSVADTGVPDTGPGDSGKETGPVDSGPPPDAGGNVAYGGACTRDGDCATGVCGTARIFPSPEVLAKVGGKCTQTCANSGDCPANSVCMISDSGANFCVAGAPVGRTSFGTGVAGAACTVDGNCRSGLCNGNKCFDTCTNTSSCTGACKLSGYQNFFALSGAPNLPVYGFACVTGTGSATGATCTKDTDCASGLCDTDGKCTTTCEKDADCTGPKSCRFVVIDTLTVPICTGATGGANGTACGSGSSCKSNVCDVGANTCAAVCMSSKTCGNGKTCRPAAAPAAALPYCQ